MVLKLALWQEILLAGLALTSLVYVLYFRIWAALAVGSDLLFASALGLAVASVALPFAFEPVAVALVERSPLPEALEAADAKVAEIEALPGKLVERALAKIGVEPEPEPRPEPEETAGPLEPDPGPGPFESKIRPSVDVLVLGVLRAACFVSATLLLFMSLALRSSTSTARELRRLSGRLAKLEADSDLLARSNSIGAEHVMLPDVPKSLP